jgi:hypothetical protein
VPARAAEARGVHAEVRRRRRLHLGTRDGIGQRRRGGFDLVTGFFLHTRLPDTREELLTRVAAHVAPGGSLLLVSHATMPPWAAEHDEKFDHGMDHHHERVSPNGDFALLIGASPTGGRSNSPRPAPGR